MGYLYSVAQKEQKKCSKNTTEGSDVLNSIILTTTFVVSIAIISVLTHQSYNGYPCIISMNVLRNQDFGFQSQITL